LIRISLRFIIAIIAISISALFIASPLIVKIPGKTGAELIRNANTVSVGTIDVDAVKQIIKFQPTADYIASKLGNQTIQYKGIVIIPQTVDDMINMLKQRSIDLYIDSPLTTALVDEESGAIPFLVRWKEGVDQYHSVFIVRKDSPINSSKDFVGKTIAFEAPESTSGYLLPKAYLFQKGFRLIGESAESYLGRFNSIGERPTSTSTSSKHIYNNTNFVNNSTAIKYVFAKEDQNIPLWIVEGKADIGVLSNIDLEQQTPKTIKSQLKVVERTIDVPRHVVSHRSELDPSLVKKITHILLDMDKDPEGIKILNKFDNTTKYEVISNKDQKTLTAINGMLPLLE
jgi:ABC-type phosphate/phosphonate transport system substrate-binding protein